MARLLTAGAETRKVPTATAAEDAEGESLTLVGACTIDTTNKRGGAASWSFGASASNFIARAGLGSTLGRTYYMRGALRFTGLPTVGNASILMEIRSAGALALQLRYTAAGRLQLFDSLNIALVPTLSAVLTQGQWYVVEIAINVPAAGNGTVSLRIDGVDVATGVAANVGNVAPSIWRWGHVNTETVVTTQVDDIAINDDQGADQNSWCGLGQVIHLFPVADSAVGTGWLEADGTTGTLWDNVNNTPPTGVAATPTVGATQIKNAVNNTTTNYDAAVTDYTTGGIPAGAAIALTRMGARCAGSSTTGTNDAGLQSISNPADAAETTAPAVFDSVATADSGTPTSWRTATTPYIYAPTPTRGTQPVIRVGKRTAATRVHMVDQMWLQVEWAPAPVDANARTIIWDTLVATGGPVDALARTLLWDTQAAADALARSLRWDTLASANAAARTLLWDLRAAVDATARSLLWNTLTSANALARTLLWDTRAATNALARTILWDTTGTVSALARTLLWDTRAATDALARSLRWDTLAQADAAARTILWDALAATDALARTLLWDDAAGGGASAVNALARTLLWDDAGQANVLRTLSWDTQAAVQTAARTLLWDVSNAVTAAARTLRWDILGGVDALRTLRWDTQAAVSRLLDILWRVDADQPPLSVGGVVRRLRMKRPRRRRR